MKHLVRSWALPLAIWHMMNKRGVVVAMGFVALILLAVYATVGHLHLPGHGNWEERNFKESIVRHASSMVAHGQKVEYGSKYFCEDYKENDEVRFSARVIYYVVSDDGTIAEHVAQVVCNEDKDRIIDWKELREGSKIR